MLCDDLQSCNLGEMEPLSVRQGTGRRELGEREKDSNSSGVLVASVSLSFLLVTGSSVRSVMTWHPQCSSAEGARLPLTLLPIQQGREGCDITSWWGGPCTHDLPDSPTHPRSVCPPSSGPGLLCVTN